MKDLEQVNYRYSVSTYEKQIDGNHHENPEDKKVPWWFIAGIAGYGGTG